MLLPTCIKIVSGGLSCRQAWSLALGPCIQLAGWRLLAGLRGILRLVALSVGRATALPRLPGWLSPA